MCDRFVYLFLLQTGARVESFISKPTPNGYIGSTGTDLQVRFISSAHLGIYLIQFLRGVCLIILYFLALFWLLPIGVLPMGMAV